MPEGDTIKRLADRIEARLGGATVERSIFRHPRLATADLVGAELVSAEAVGKHLLVRWEGPDDLPPRTLHVHLRMDGRVLFDRARSWPEWQRHFELTFDNAAVLTGAELPIVGLLPTSRESELVGHLGPDLCGRYDHEVATARLAASGDRPLAGALLDQRIVAGFGNVFAIEVPFICAMSPFQPVDLVADPERLLAVGAALIRWNAGRSGRNTTGRNLRRGDNWIASARQRRCPVCGDLVQREPAESTPWRRRTAWCPSCQPTGSSIAVDAERVKELLGLHPAMRMVDLATGEIDV